MLLDYIAYILVYYYHIFEAKVIVDEQEISPPRLFANVGVMFNY